ncbi:TolC family protein [uncultured Duncaniella sp.]|uniref:TolC family protein n=1 Tax=uncultured Duncaniella sp. TaxID=2768039 RepID=UPI0026000ECF|nr:TolC family protein [uncultured Duncaniella sp.]
MTLRLLPLLTAVIIPAAMAGSTPFDEALAEVIGNNLSVRAEASRAQIETENILGENTLEAPEVSFSRVWGSRKEYGNKWSLGVSQSFDWPGVYAARREAARTARSASQYMLESTLLDLRQEVRTLFIDIIHNTQLIEMQTELVDRMNQMEAYYKKAAEAGAETRLDYNKTVIERIAVHRELHTLEAQRSTLMSTLSTLNGGKDIDGIIAKLGNAYPITRVPESIDKTVIMKRDPQYAAALAGVEAAKSMVKVEKRSRIPGFSIGYEHESEGDENFNGFSIGLTLPVWGRGHQIKASTLEAEASLMDAELALTRRVAEMNGDRKQLDTLRHIMDEYEPVVNEKSNYELLHKALKAGQITFLTYIEESNYFIAAKRDYLDTLYEYNLILTRLARYE